MENLEIGNSNCSEDVFITIVPRHMTNKLVLFYSSVSLSEYVLGSRKKDVLFVTEKCFVLLTNSKFPFL